MKTVLMESLGISDELLAELEKPFVEQGMEFASYSRTADPAVLVKEAQDADVMILDDKLEIRCIWQMGKIIENTLF